jgi:hypothetical protein
MHELPGHADPLNPKAEHAFASLSMSMPSSTTGRKRLHARKWTGFVVGSFSNCQPRCLTYSTD